MGNRPVRASSAGGHRAYRVQQSRGFGVVMACRRFLSGQVRNPRAMEAGFWVSAASALLCGLEQVTCTQPPQLHHGE